MVHFFLVPSLKIVEAFLVWKAVGLYPMPSTYNARISSTQIVRVRACVFVVPPRSCLPLRRQRSHRPRVKKAWVDDDSRIRPLSSYGDH